MDLDFWSYFIIVLEYEVLTAPRKLPSTSDCRPFTKLQILGSEVWGKLNTIVYVKLLTKTGNATSCAASVEKYPPLGEQAVDISQQLLA